MSDYNLNISNILDSLESCIVIFDSNYDIKYVNNSGNKIANRYLSLMEIINTEYIPIVKNGIENNFAFIIKEHFINSSPIFSTSSHSYKAIFKVIDTGLFLMEALEVHALNKANKLWKEKANKFKRASNYDCLTGVFNRKGGMEVFDNLMCNRSQVITVCFADIDGLKYVNDTFGHEEGDTYIKTVCSSLRNNLRNSDLIARFGGDEFLIVFPDTRICDAERVINRISNNFEKYNNQKKFPYKCSVSFGCVEYVPGSKIKITKEELLRKADEKMYENKKSNKQKQ